MEKYFPRCGKVPGAGASRKMVIRSARCARGDAGAPRSRARLRQSPPVTSPAGLRARRCSRSRCAVRVLARRGGVGLRVAALFALLSRSTRGRVAIDLAFTLRLWFGLCTRLFLRLGFPPCTPLSEAPFSSAVHRPGGKPIPVRSLALPHWGQPHGGHFRFECRRPSAFAKATADTVGSRRLKSPAAH